MSALKIFRVVSLPVTLVASAMYIVQASAAGQAELYFSNNDGSAARHIINAAEIQSMINDTIPAVASAASKLETARTIKATGDATWEVTFDGSANATAALTLVEVTTAGTGAVVTYNAKGQVTSSRGLTAADVPSLPGSKISSDISVNTSGNAATATKLANARKINGVDFDGSADITINAVDATARIAASEKAQPNGVATLDANGLVPANQLPSYVDDVIEVANYAALPVSGESSKIYVTLDNNYIYRWTGSSYIQIPGGVGLSDAALKLHTARSITATGDVSWTVSFDGTGNVTAAATLADVVSAGTGSVVTYNAKGLVTGSRALVAADVPQLDQTNVTAAGAVYLGSSEW